MKKTFIIKDESEHYMIKADDKYDAAYLWARMYHGDEDNDLSEKPKNILVHEDGYHNEPTEFNVSADIKFTIRVIGKS